MSYHRYHSIQSLSSVWTLLTLTTLSAQTCLVNDLKYDLVIIGWENNPGEFMRYQAAGGSCSRERDRECHPHMRYDLKRPGWSWSSRACGVLLLREKTPNMPHTQTQRRSRGLRSGVIVREPVDGEKPLLTTRADRGCGAVPPSEACRLFLSCHIPLQSVVIRITTVSFSSFIHGRADAGSFLVVSFVRQRPCEARICLRAVMCLTLGVCHDWAGLNGGLFYLHTTQIILLRSQSGFCKGWIDACITELTLFMSLSIVKSLLRRPQRGADLTLWSFWRL